MLIHKMNKKQSTYKALYMKFIFSFLFFFSSFAMSSSLVGVKYNTMQNEEIKLTFVLSEPIMVQPQVKTAMNPASIGITFDIDDFDIQLENTLVEHAGVENITVQKLSGKIVATIHMDKLSVFDVTQVGNEFSLVLNKGLKNTSIAMLPDLGKDFINHVQALDFRKGQESEAQILVDLADSMVAVDVSDKLGKLYVEFHNTDISEELLYELDVTDFGTIVTGIETFKEGRNARLVIDVEGEFTFKHKQLNNVFSLTVVEKVKVPGYLGDSDDFTGKAISLNFQDIPVRTVLQIIADYNGFNLVTSDTVAGNITLRLDGVPWDQALDIILKVKGLDKRMEGNILMVAPSDELAAREARDLQALQQVEELAPLYSEYVQVNYAKASELADLVFYQTVAV